VARDLYSGRALVVFFARLMLISGFAPVVAPVLGGQLTRVMSWRGIFLVLAAFGLLLLLAGLTLPESLPPERRTTGGIAVTLRGFRILLGDRLFVGAALSSGLVGASLFAYIAGSTFVLQEIYGLSPQAFSLVFGANSVAILAMGQLAAGLTRWWSAGQILALGVLVNLLGAAALAVSVLAGLGLWFVVVSLLVMVSAVGLVFAPATALAMADYPEQAGAASSLLGLGQYIAGALVAPLVGLGGSQSATPLAVVALASSIGAGVVYALLVRPALRSQV
jgi:DHA1 family bicyclomycin/chloramphenicol resistance-like MFS transporter